MNLFRLQNNTPPIYTDESRDFQLFCRLYDCINSGTKFDVDQVTGILNSFTIRSNLLPLLQTKLGFFSKKKMNDTALRYILDAFPDMVRKKGSLEGIQQAVNTFLKIYGIRTEVVIYRSGAAGIGVDVTSDEHTIVVAMNSAVKDMSILEEVFKYVFPVGFAFQFYFFNDLEQMLKIVVRDSIQYLYISDNLNSLIRRQYVMGVTGQENIANQFLDTRVGGVDTTEIASTDSLLEGEE